MSIIEESIDIDKVDQFIGQKLKILRESKKISQEGLAKRLGKLIKEGKSYSYHTIRNYEQGKSKFTAQILMSLSKIFKVDVTYFLRTKNRIIFESPNNADIIIELDKNLRTKFIKLYNELNKIENPCLIDKLIELMEEIVNTQKK